MIKQLDTQGEDFSLWFVGYDVNGNSRYVVHYLAIPYEDDETQSFFTNQANHIEHARRALKGKKYRAAWFGGGIVFQAYADNPIEHVKAAIAGMNQGDYYRRARSMEAHPSGSAL